MTREVRDCDRCKCKGQMVNSLRFVTDERDTVIYLCDICMGASRLIWRKFMSDGTLPALKDDSLMDFGLHKDKPMSSIPAEYLIWCGNQDWIQNKPRLHRYIEKNRDALEEEIARNE
jgi:hypothetical protein